MMSFGRNSFAVRSIFEVQPLGLAVDAVVPALVDAPREVSFRPVREVPAHRQGHRQYPVARFQEREVDRHVRLRPRVRLDVGAVGAEYLFGALDGKALAHVHVLAAAVVARAGVAFGVLVGEHRPLRVQHRLRDVVLRGDHLELHLLPTHLFPHGVVDLRVHASEFAQH